MYAWENNPNGICEDAPACGCCGPQGDGRYDPDEPPEYDDYYSGADQADDEPICNGCDSYVDTDGSSRTEDGYEVWYCAECFAEAGTLA